MTPNFEPDPFEEALRNELQLGERVLWKGRKLRRFDFAALAVFFFAIPWTAFAIFWTMMAASGIGEGGFEGSGWIAYAFPAFGLPFIAVGLLMMAGPFVRYFTANNTLFAVTDRRLVEITLGRRITVKSTEGDRLGDITRSEGRDGSGKLTIEVPPKGGSGRKRSERILQLGEVMEIREAEQRIRELQQISS